LTVIGSLEDLSFPDILQVVHVSRQSGTLILSGSQGGRRVRFENGLVCGATLGEGGPELEDLLLQRGLIDAGALKTARERSARSGGQLSSALIALGAVTQETIERVVRNELRAILRSLVLLQEGEFRFEVEDPAPAPAGHGIGLREGLGPDSILQGLPLRGGARPARAPRAAAPRGHRDRRHVLLVIERSLLRFKLKDELVRRGLEIEACATPTEGLTLARSLAATGVPFSLVCDLLLPGAAGRGEWRGGLDLVRRVRELAPDLTAILIGDLRDPAIVQEARGAGAAAYLPLPDLSAAGLADVEARFGRFCAEVRDGLEHPERLAAPTAGAPGSVRVVDQMSLLRGLIGEMRAEEESGIPLLVLRLAAEYFERGVLFAVRDGEACGAGAFGGAPGDPEGGGLDARIRGVSLPLQRGSVLQHAVQERETYVGPISPTRPNASLLERLGAPEPGEAALLPLLSGRHVFGILYGDNARTGRPVGDLKALEIFLSQAGIALENSFLQRRIASLASGGTGPRGGRGSASHA